MKFSLFNFFVLAALGCALSTVNAQTKGINYPEWNIRTSVTSFFDYDAGLMLGVGCRLSDRFSAAFEPTWILYNSFESEFETRTYPSGIKIRTDVKIYLNKIRKRKVEFFLAPEYHYKYVETQKKGRFGINCIGRNCSFFQDAYYTEIKKEQGGLLKIGLNCWFPFVREPRFLLEFNTGFGLKTRKFRETKLPSGGTFVNQPDHSIFLRAGTEAGVPLFPLGMKLLFILKSPTNKPSK